MLKGLTAITLILSASSVFAQTDKQTPVAVDASGLPVLVEAGGFFSSFSRLEAYDPDTTYEDDAYLFLINTMKQRMALDHFMRHPSRKTLLTTQDYGLIQEQFDKRFKGVSFYEIDKARFWLEEEMIDYMRSEYRFRFMKGENLHTKLMLNKIGEFSGYDLEKPLNLITRRIRNSGDPDTLMAKYDGKTLDQMLTISPF